MFIKLGIRLHVVVFLLLYRGVATWMPLLVWIYMGW